MQILIVSELLDLPTRWVFSYAAFAQYKRHKSEHELKIKCTFEPATSLVQGEGITLRQPAPSNVF